MSSLLPHSKIVAAGLLSGVARLFEGVFASSKALEVDAEFTTLVGSDIAAWADLADNGLTIEQPSGALRPSLVEAGFGSRAVASFDGTGECVEVDGLSESGGAALAALTILRWRNDPETATTKRQAICDFRGTELFLYGTYNAGRPAYYNDDNNSWYEASAVTIDVTNVHFLWTRVSQSAHEMHHGSMAEYDDLTAALPAHPGSFPASLSTASGGRIGKHATADATEFDGEIAYHGLWFGADAAVPEYADVAASLAALGFVTS